jgi:hypothetical protein
MLSQGFENPDGGNVETWAPWKLPELWKSTHDVLSHELLGKQKALSTVPTARAGFYRNLFPRTPATCPGNPMPEKKSSQEAPGSTIGKSAGVYYPLESLVRTLLGHARTSSRLCGKYPVDVWHG